MLLTNEVSESAGENCHETLTDEQTSQQTEGVMCAIWQLSRASGLGH